MVSALAFYSDDQSLNHADVDSLKSVKCLNTTNINKKDAGDGHLNIRSFIKIFKFFFLKQPHLFNLAGLGIA